MVQMLTKLKPLGRPKAPRPTAKLENTTVRDFGGGLNVVDSEQNLTSKFSPVFDNMITYTDRRVGPRNGYEMWLKLKQGEQTFGSASVSITTSNVFPVAAYIITINWAGHPFAEAKPLQHVTISDWDQTFNGVTPEQMNRTHSVRHVVDADHFEIVLATASTAIGTSAVETINWVQDTHMMGGEPVECRYFANLIIVWTSTGDIFTVDREKSVQRIWSAAIAYARAGNPVGWSHTELVAQDIFGAELVCSNGHDKPLSIDFTRDSSVGPPVIYLIDPDPDNATKAPAFDACKSAFRYFTIHDTEPTTYPDHKTEIRIASKDSATLFTGMDSGAVTNDAVDVDMSKVTASPEQTVRGFAVIKDALLVITPTATTLMKLGNVLEDGSHDPIPVDTLSGFGSNAPRSIVEIGSDVFMIDFNGVPSAKLSTVSNAVQAERVSNYIESMMSKHIGRLKKETMRLKTFGFYDSKNRTVHFYLPKFDVNDPRLLTSNPFYFDSDMAENEYTQSSLIVRVDDHQFEENDMLDVSNATDFAGINANNFINGRRRVLSVLNENYILMTIGTTLPQGSTMTEIGGGGINVRIDPVVNSTIGYAYHYVPQLKLFAWSRFKLPNNMQFNCGCGTLEGRSFLFTKDGYMMRYGSPDHQVHGDWFGMYDYASWVSGQEYFAGERVFDGIDGLVYKCITDVTTTAGDFPDARELAPDSWEEYKGEPIKFDWELPWADFGARQRTKSLRFVHIDANGEAPFKLEVFADNIYKDAATGQYMPARSLTFVPNEAGAFGAGQQVYGAGRRTREQKLWTVPVKHKIIKTRISGATTGPLSISGISFMYQKGSVVRG